MRNLRLTICFIISLIIAAPTFAQDDEKYIFRETIGVSAGISSYKTFSRYDYNKPYLTSPSFVSVFPELDISYRVRNIVEEHFISFKTSLLSKLDFDDGTGNNRTINKSSSSMLRIPVRYYYVWYVFPNPPIGFGPAVNIIYNKGTIDYKSAGKTNYWDLRTSAGMIFTIQIAFTQKVNLRTELINQYTVPFLSKGKYSSPVYSSNYRAYILNSNLNLFLSYRMNEKLKIGIGFDWEEFAGDGKLNDTVIISKYNRFGKLYIKTRFYLN